MKNIQEIIDEIITLRTKGLNCVEEGQVICQFRELTNEEKKMFNSPVNLINSFFMSDLSFDGSLHNRNIWNEIEFTTAHRIIIHALTDNYGLPENGISPKIATELSKAFMEIFSGNPRFFTNGKYNFEEGSYTFKSAITVSVYYFIESGVVCIDDKYIGILWVTDND